MSDQLQEFLDIPRDFIKDGTQFVNRCTKRMFFAALQTAELPIAVCGALENRVDLLTFNIADRREFLKISQAVGIGFLVMGAVGYLVKLSE